MEKTMTTTKLYVASVLAIAATTADALDVYDADGRHIGPLVQNETTIRAAGHLFRIGINKTGFHGIAPVGFAIDGCDGEAFVQPSDDLVPPAAESHGVVWAAPDDEQPIRRHIESALLPSGECVKVDGDFYTLRAVSPIIWTEEFSTPFSVR